MEMYAFIERWRRKEEELEYYLHFANFIRLKFDGTIVMDCTDSPTQLKYKTTTTL